MKTLHSLTPPAIVMPGITARNRVGLEVWGVVDVSENDDGSTECEQLDPVLDDITPHFWSVYEHQQSGECMVIDDFASREDALAAAIRLAGPREIPVYDFTREGYHG